MRQAGITNNMFTNQYDSSVRITAITHTAESGTTEMNIFSTEFTVVSGQISLNLEPLVGKTKAMNDIMQRRGFLGGTTSGEVQLQAKETSITLKNDMCFLTDSKGTEMSKNIITALINGEGFMFDGKYRKVIGTNGTYKRGFNTHTNMFFGKLFELDGRLIIPEAATELGDACTIKNMRAPAYSKTCNYIIFEIIEKYDDDNIDGYRFVYAMNSGLQFSDATDANEISFTQTQLCDARKITNFVIEGYSDDEVGENIPARRVSLNKTPVSAFKAKIDGADVDLNGQVLLADIVKPTNEVIVEISTGDSKTVEYTPELGDVVSFYVTDTERTGYALGIVEAGYTYGTDVEITTGTIGTDLLVIGGTSGISEGDMLAIFNGATLIQYVTVDNVASLTTLDLQETLVATVDGFVFKKVTNGNSAYVQLIKADYTLSEKAVFNGGAIVPSAKATGGTPAKALTSALIPVYDYNFEDLTFEQL